MSNKKVYEIDGAAFSTLEGFYEVISHRLIPGADWGKNLDAFNDILRGGFGTPDEGFTIKWKNAQVSEERLGYPETVRQLKKRLQSCHSSFREHVKKEIEEAKKDNGPTVFDWLVEIIQAHHGDGVRLLLSRPFFQKAKHVLLKRFEKISTDDTHPQYLSYLNPLKEFVEGKKSLIEWPAWWQENAPLIKKQEGRRYSTTETEKMEKFCNESRSVTLISPWRDVACQILNHHRIEYTLNDSISWNRCGKCGEPVFRAIPGETSEQELVDFLQNSSLPAKEELLRDHWMHPGVYCPNGCYAIMFHL